MSYASACYFVIKLKFPECQCPVLTPSCVDVKAIEEEVLYGGPDPERHAALAIKHRFSLNIALTCHNHIVFDNSALFWSFCHAPLCIFPSQMAQRVLFLALVEK